MQQTNNIPIDTIVSIGTMTACPMCGSEVIQHDDSVLSFACGSYIIIKSTSSKFSLAVECVNLKVRMINSSISNT